MQRLAPTPPTSSEAGQNLQAAPGTNPSRVPSTRREAGKQLSAAAATHLATKLLLNLGILDIRVIQHVMQQRRHHGRFRPATAVQLASMVLKAAESGQAVQRHRARAARA